MSRTRTDAGPASDKMAAFAPGRMSASIDEELTLPEEGFMELSLWIDEHLAALELRYESFVTVDSRKRNLRRNR